VIGIIDFLKLSTDFSLNGIFILWSFKSGRMTDAHKKENGQELNQI
jgi:hypothetical protein